jgi:hypothetical protein
MQQLKILFVTFVLRLADLNCKHKYAIRYSDIIYKKSETSKFDVNDHHKKLKK